MSRVINPYDVILSNKGYMKINEIEIAELKDIEISFETDLSKIKMLGTLQNGEVITDVQGVIKFSFHKITSRFKQKAIECYKKGNPFTFKLELTTKGSIKDSFGNYVEEDVFIGVCWLNKGFTIAELNADAKFLSDTYTAGFLITSLEFNPISDGNEWDCIKIY